MATNIVAVGRRVLVWMVSLAAMIEATAHALVAVTHSAYAEVGIWSGAALTTLAVGLEIEKTKSLLGE